jgi:hypothetical protein
MKIFSCIILVCWMCLASAKENPGRLTVKFVQLDNFTDVALSGADTTNTRQYVLDTLAKGRLRCLMFLKTQSLYQLFKLYSLGRISFQKLLLRINCSVSRAVNG